jgi:hypothetical protein
MADANNSNLAITVTVRPASKPGSVKGHADVRVLFNSSSLEIFGASIVQQDPAKPAWVSYPQRAGKDGKKYFSVVKVTGVLHEKICSTVLAEWEKVARSSDNGGVPRAQIPREPGADEEQIPF